jgi:TP901 family phage tail tape measure protein
MSKFVLTAELELRAPRNSRQIISNIQNQLNGVKIDLKVKNSAQAARQIAGVNKQLKESNDLASNLGKNLGVSIRRFTAFAIATRGVSLFTNSLSNATKEAIDFERELIKISQVTRRDIEDLQELENTITRLATSLGASSQSLLSATRILAQAGIEASRLEVALTALAKTTLAPTFEDIGKTAEGAIAILSQFGKGVGALEQQLGAINAVAGQFAVESGDLISAVRRTGGVFVSAGGQLEELLGLFTSVRATTRESAESIATGLRTILTRIQRPTTIKYLEQFGVKLTDLNGKFVGPFEAIKRLSQALRGLEQGDIKFVEIAEELGGFRQIGKVIPLLQQFEVAERARQAAIEGGTSLDEDARKAQASLAVQIEKTREKFLALIRSFSETGTFQTASRTVLRLADSFVELADSIKPILPLIGAVGAFKALKGISGFGRALKGGFTGQTRNQGGKILGFNTGGFVPGVGNSDTVPAMLTPGEFVIRKSSVKKLGAGTLAAMNNNKFAQGGSVANFNATKSLTLDPDIDPTFYKPKGVEFSASGENRKRPTRLNPEDEFKYSRTGDKRINIENQSFINRLPKKDRNKDYLAYKSAVKTGDDRARGRAFEDVLEAAGEIKPADGTGFGAGQPRIDAFSPSGRKIIEIKSKKEAIDDANINAKMIGSAVDPKANTDSIVKDRFTNNVALTPKKNTFDLGSIAVYEDITSGLGKKFFGGLIQKFATGGIVDQKAAGAAILDPEAASSKKINITGEDIKKEFTEFKSLPKGKDPVSKYYKSSSFNIAKSGLNKETSDKFKMSLEDGLVAGINTSTASLANDLGTPNAKIDKSQTSNFIKSINTSIFGRLFETTMDSISRSGQYATPDNDSDRPFDAPNGLPASLKDNFSGLPDQYIDYKASLEAASDANMKGKIVDQIKRELIQDGILNEEYPRKEFRDKERASSQAKTQKKKRANQAAGRGFPVKRANGGPAPSDTVPALLTPGEFVFNASAAKSIGYANLNKMNKQGVAGFAKGGPVGVQRFESGGSVSSAGGSKGFIDNINKKGEEVFEKVFKAIDRGGMKIYDFFVEFASKAQKSGEKVSQSLDDAAEEISNNSTSSSLSSKPSGGQKDAGFDSLTSSTKALTSANEENAREVEKKSSAEIFGSITMASAFIPRVEEASTAAQRMQNSFLDSVTTISATITALEAFGISLTKQSLLGGLGTKGGFGKGFKEVLKGVGARIAVFGSIAYAAGSLIDAYSGKQEEANKAIEEGNVAQAASASVAAQVASSQTKLAAGAVALGAAFGPIGLGVGLVAGGLIKFGLSAEQATYITDQFGRITGNTTALVAAQATAAAERVRLDKQLAESSKKASQTLEAFAQGGATLDQALMALSGGLKEEMQISESKTRLAQAEIAAQKQRTSILGFGGPDQEVISKNNKTIEEETKNREKLATEALNKGINSEILRKAINDSIAAGKPVSAEELINKIIPKEARGMIDDEDIKNAELAINNMADAAQRNADFLRALNFGLQGVTAAIDARVVKVENTIASFEPGFNSLSIAARTLEASITAAGANIDSASIDKSLVSLEQQFLRFGGDQKEVENLSNTIRELNRIQKEAVNIIPNINKKLEENIDFTGSSSGLTDILKEELLELVPDDSPIRDRLLAIIGNLEFDKLPEEIQNQIKKGDISGLVQSVFGELGQATQVQIESFKKTAELQDKLKPILQKRIELEKDLVSAQKDALKVQIEAAKAIEKFGGPAVAFAEQLENLNRQLNLDLAAAGIGGTASGSSPDDLVAINRRLVAEIESINAAGPLPEGRGEEQKARRSQLETLQKSLLDNLRQRIGLTEQEIELAKKKNDLEKSALQKLIEGDAIGFFEQQETAAAASALKSGDQRALRLFTQDAIGRAFASLQTEDQTPQERRRQARAALGGFATEENVSILSETTPEFLDLQRSGREAARALQEVADTASQIVKSDLVRVDANVVELRGQINKPQKVAGNTQTLSSGDTVYANNGVFVPRGTDTVPAMLTPGEFVVNRKAVQSGSNLSILQNMNSGKTVYASTGGMISNGVLYAQEGALAPEDNKKSNTARAEFLLANYPDRYEMIERGGGVFIKDLKTNTEIPFQPSAKTTAAKERDSNRARARLNSAIARNNMSAGTELLVGPLNDAASAASYLDPTGRLGLGSALVKGVAANLVDAELGGELKQGAIKDLQTAALNRSITKGMTVASPYVGKAVTAGVDKAKAVASKIPVPNAVGIDKLLTFQAGANSGVFAKALQSVSYRLRSKLPVGTSVTDDVTAAAARESSKSIDEVVRNSSAGANAAKSSGSAQQAAKTAGQREANQATSGAAGAAANASSSAAYASARQEFNKLMAQKLLGNFSSKSQILATQADDMAKVLAANARTSLGRLNGKYSPEVMEQLLNDARRQVKSATDSFRAAKAANAAKTAGTGAKQTEIITVGSEGRANQEVAKNLIEDATVYGQTPTTPLLGSPLSSQSTVAIEAPGVAAARAAQSSMKAQIAGYVDDIKIVKNAPLESKYGEFVARTNTIQVAAGERAAEALSHEGLHAANNILSKIAAQNGGVVPPEVYSELSKQLIAKGIPVGESALKISGKNVANRSFAFATSKKQIEGNVRQAIRRADVLIEEIRVAQALKFGEGIENVGVSSVAGSMKRFSEAANALNPAKREQLFTKLSNEFGKNSPFVLDGSGKIITNGTRAQAIEGLFGKSAQAELGLTNTSLITAGATDDATRALTTTGGALTTTGDDAARGLINKPTSVTDDFTLPPNFTNTSAATVNPTDDLAARIRAGTQSKINSQQNALDQQLIAGIVSTAEQAPVTATSNLMLQDIFGEAFSTTDMDSLPATEQARIQTIITNAEKGKIESKDIDHVFQRYPTKEAQKLKLAQENLDGLQGAVTRVISESDFERIKSDILFDTALSSGLGNAYMEKNVPEEELLATFLEDLEKQEAAVSVARRINETLKKMGLDDESLKDINYRQKTIGLKTTGAAEGTIAKFQEEGKYDLITRGRIGLTGLFGVSEITNARTGNEIDIAKEAEDAALLNTQIDEANRKALTNEADELQKREIVKRILEAQAIRDRALKDKIREEDRIRAEQKRLNDEAEAEKKKPSFRFDSKNELLRQQRLEAQAERERDAERRRIQFESEQARRQEEFNKRRAEQQREQDKARQALDNLYARQELEYRVKMAGGQEAFDEKNRVEASKKARLDSRAKREGFGSYQEMLNSKRAAYEGRSLEKAEAQEDQERALKMDRISNFDRRYNLERQQDLAALEKARSFNNTRQVERLERKLQADEDQYKITTGQVIERSPLGKVQNMPVSSNLPIADTRTPEEKRQYNRQYDERFLNDERSGVEPSLVYRELLLKEEDEKPDYKQFGGLIYASRGRFIPKTIFKPRGTDTVPAMLTPGEFVVNRQAVRAGNNLAILKAMNSQPAAPAAQVATMSNGGPVGSTQYFQNGGEVSGGGQDSAYLQALEGQLASLAQKLETGFSSFGRHVETFQSATQTEMAVNVNQNGMMRVEAGSSLTSSLMQNSKDIATSSVNGQIERSSIGLDGKMRTTNSVLG